MSLVESISVEMGNEAKNFSLKGVDGKKHSLSDYTEARALVLIFMCNHCPYVQAIWGRLNALQDRFADRGLQLIGINPNTANEGYEEESFEKMKDYAREYEMNFPYLEDKDQSVSKLYQAQCTPDIYLYNSERKLVYHGRLDDSWRDGEGVQKEDLALAIETLLDGGTPNEDQVSSMGCSIKWK
jgi:peroxiredoxin